MAKGDKFYFENLTATTALSKDAAAYLVECLENYDPDRMEQMLANMHEIEHNADKKTHAMNEALAKAFVTPVEREDLDMLSRKLDEVTDRIEEILQKFYIYDIQTVTPSAVEFAKHIVKACELLCALMQEFENFKRSKKIQSLIIEINDVEEVCDHLYLSSMRKLTRESTDILTTISWRKVYDCLEACVDACEHVSECVSTVIMKNT